MRVRFAAVAALVLAVAAPAPAVGQPEVTHVDLTVRYTCDAGLGPISARITADLPASGAVGEPIRPSSVGLALTLPLPELPSVASLTAIARLDTTVTGRGPAVATWSGMRSEPVPVADPLVLDLPVENPPPVVVGAPGDVVFAAAGLTVSLSGYRADGTATEPPVVEATCVPAAGEVTRLATIAVSVAMAPAPGTPGTRPPPGAVVVDPDTPEEPSLGTRAVEIPADCEIIDPPPGPPTAARYCVYVTGFANVAKLDAAVEQPPGIVNIGPTQFYPNCQGDSKLRCQEANLLPNLGGEPSLPETESSFFAFGFVPITAKMVLTQIGLGFADVKLDTQAPHVRSGAVVTGKYVARIYDATVDGVPFDLGPACRTAQPLEISVRANVPPYTLTNGGLLDGMVTIPPFSGCGVTEDLDPLLTGMVSGPDNYVRLTQGRVCTLTGSQGGCPPQLPTPQ
jgi:hypothetical protein